MRTIKTDAFDELESSQFGGIPGRPNADKISRWMLKLIRLKLLNHALHNGTMGPNSMYGTLCLCILSCSGAP
jgi:hypothetical protein